MSDIVTLTMNPAIDLSTATDRVEAVRKLRCATELRDPGGGGINVARVVRRFGVHVAALFPVGGEIGELLRRCVSLEGIHTIVTEIAHETRENFTVFEESTGREFRFVLPGPPLSENEWRRCLDLAAGLIPHPRYLVVSGSLPTGVPDDFYVHLTRLARGWGAKVVLDTSGPALGATLQEGVYLVKPSLREFRELLGEPLREEADWVAGCRRIIDGGQAEIVALTLGERGAIVAAGDAVWRARPLPITPRSAVGAGDSFLGAMIWQLAGGASLDQAFRYAVAAGSAALLTPGTELCRRDDVERLLPDVAIEKL